MEGLISIITNLAIAVICFFVGKGYNYYFRAPKIILRVELTDIENLSLQSAILLLTFKFKNISSEKAVDFKILKLNDNINYTIHDYGVNDSKMVNINEHSQSIGFDIQLSFHPNDINISKSVIVKVLSNNYPLTVHFTYLNKQGRIFEKKITSFLSDDIRNETILY